MSLYGNFLSWWYGAEQPSAPPHLQHIVSQVELTARISTLRPTLQTRAERTPEPPLYVELKRVHAQRAALKKQFAAVMRELRLAPRFRRDRLRSIRERRSV